MRVREEQAGWTLIVVLIALAIVAFLARDALTQYFGGLNRAASMSESRLPPAAHAVPDANSATPVPTAPSERARAVEDVVRQQHDALGKHIDRVAR